MTAAAQISPVRGRNRVPAQRENTEAPTQSRPVRLIASDIDFCAWLSQAEPGDTLEYYRGLLAADREPSTKRLSKPECIALHQVADFAWRAANKGLIHLVQRRLGPDRFSYLAIARPKPANAVQILARLVAGEAA